MSPYKSRLSINAQAECYRHYKVEGTTCVQDEEMLNKILG